MAEKSLTARMLVRGAIPLSEIANTGFGDMQVRGQTFRAAIRKRGGLVKIHAGAQCEEPNSSEPPTTTAIQPRSKSERKERPPTVLAESESHTHDTI